MTARTETLSVRRPMLSARVADLLAANSLLVVLVALLGTVLLAVAPQLLVADSWMTLAAGREIAQHGLPSHETLTTIPLGRTWTDQQWLAQIVFYGTEWLGGLRLAVILNVLLVTLTLGIGIAVARQRGASARTTLFVAAASMFVAPWSWQLRAQALALPLFVIVLWLTSTDVRMPRRRTFLALPLVALWANLHGSVLVGAALVSLAGLAGLVELVRRNPEAPRAARSAALLLAPWACVIVSPYGFHLLGYYRLMLFTSPVSKVIVEWQAPKPHGWFLIFFVLAALTVLVSVWHRRRLMAYDLAVLAMTLGGSLRSGRGIVWFALSMLVLVPVALDGVFGDRPAPPVRRREGMIVAAVSVAVLLLTLAGIATRSNSWYEKLFPARAAAAVARTAADVPAGGAVYPSEKHADWLLWKEPSLRGRVAYDVRFELLTGAQLENVVRFKSRAKGWQSAAAGYPILVLDPVDGKARIRTLRRAPGTTVLYEDESVVVLRRGSSS